MFPHNLLGTQFGYCTPLVRPLHHSLYNQGYDGKNNILQLPRWLERYDGDRPAALLRYMVFYMPNRWHVFSFGSYGILVSNAEVNIIKNPHVHEIKVQRDFLARPLVCFEIGSVHAKAVLQNQLEIWIVENEGNAKYPFTFLARESILHFLLDTAKPNAIWGGKLNCSLPGLAEAATRYKGKPWIIRPSVAGDRDSLVLHRGVDVEAFDMPCGSDATFFGVDIRVDLTCAEKPSKETLQQPQLAKDLAAHADEDDDATKEIVHEMMRFLGLPT